MTETRWARDAFDGRVLASELVEASHSIRTVALVVCAVSLQTLTTAQIKSLPTGVIKALSDDEAQCCKAVSGKFEKGCDQRFVANLHWRELQITPSRETGILVENRNAGFCGSAGCSLNLFVQRRNGKYVEVFDEVGSLERIQVLKTVTKGHYDLKKTWAHREGKTIYTWDGSAYTSAD
jgi:hypothetical protein